MQETQYNNEIRQRVFSGVDEEDIQNQMNKALRPGERVIRRIQLDESTIHAINRHERRKAAALARKKR